MIKEQRPSEDISTPLPPIDVLLMWHAHMLCPWRYNEDMFHFFRDKRPPLTFPLHASSFFDRPQDIDNLSVGAWEAYTGMPFLLDLNNLPSFSSPCDCGTNRQVIAAQEYIPFRTQSAPLACRSCQRRHFFESATILRFLSDVQRFVDAHENRDANRTGAVSLVRGCALNYSTGEVDLARALEDLKLLFLPEDPLAKRAIKELLARPHDHQFSWAELETVLLKHVAKISRNSRSKCPAGRLRRLTIRMLIKAYSCTLSPFTIDLVAAVKRQRDFNRKMVDGTVQWNEHNLARATVRYHKFLLLMAAQPSKFLVPTLDIDLAWHTHQLHSDKYQQYGLKHMKHIVNHDDTVSDRQLKHSFKDTGVLWARHFNGMINESRYV
ncbi:hypothetical protein BC832DRAFT_100611 [Gaertneriomyces semiglobifer]|nr:hypothetical protein BC832DRAFT_100611 [Gaertneriomyces semiglobifer]